MENVELLWILGREEGEGYEGKVIFGERSKRKTLYLESKNEEWVICEGKDWMERLLNTRKDYVDKITRGNQAMLNLAKRRVYEKQ